MFIANIVSDSKINVSQEFNVVKNFDDIINSLPTLLVGYNIVDEYYPEFDITNINVVDNIYWIFKRSENRDQYEIGLDIFINKIYSDLFKELNYIFVDFINFKLKSIKKIISKIYEIKNKTTYIYRDMIYLYGDNLIFGIDLKLLKFIGVDVNKIKNKLKVISTHFLENDDTLSEYINTIEILDNKIRFLPFIYSIRN